MKSVRFGFLSLLVLGVAVCGAQAENPAEIRQVVEKMAALQKGAFHVVYSANMTTSQFGSETKISMSGTLTQADPDRQRNELTATMAGIPGMPEDSEMRVLSVLDGKTMWIEQANPMLGRMVLKLGVDQIGELGKLGGNVGGNFGVDPISQMIAMIERADLETMSRDDGRIRLSGSLSAGADPAAGESLPVPGLDRFELLVVESTGVPIEFGLGGATMVVRFSDFEALDADSIDAETFRYSVPEGVQVMDIGAMLGSMPAPAAP